MAHAYSPRAAYAVQLKKSVILVTLCALHLTSAVLPGLEACDASTSISSSLCTWRTRAAPSQDIVLSGARVAPMPVLYLNDSANVADQWQAGYSLTLRRLVLVNATLAPIQEANLPALWPRGMFAAVGSSLSMADVRLLVSDDEFKQYLRHFEGLPGSVIHYHSDNSSWLHIAHMSYRNTTARSVTLISGPCKVTSIEALLDTRKAMAAAAAATNGGCAVRAVDNDTLIPVLLFDGSVTTEHSLLIIVTSNVTLGPGLRAGAIHIRRPVMIAGLMTLPTSVDFGMVVNQLNVTAPYAHVIWQGLILENLAPGDATSSAIAAPFSAAISWNVWAVFCNRSEPRQCLHLYNCTLVLATQDEMDYTTFMFSMYNSPLPSMREITDFYDTELKVGAVQFVPGPGEHAITVLNLTSLGWDFENVIMTTEPVLAPKLPIPPGPFVSVSSVRAGPLLQAVSSCTILQAAARYPTKADREHVWLLVNNISLAPPDNSHCWQPQDITHPTRMFSQPENLSGRDKHHDLHEELIPNKTEDAQAQDPNAAPLPAVQYHICPGIFALGFGFIRSAMRLPDYAPDKYMKLENVTLTQLPQGPKANAPLTEGGRTPPDLWTVLLWSIERSFRDSPLLLMGVQLMLPEPEWTFLANSARASSSFVLQLEGLDTFVTFTSATVVGNALSVAMLQGPGMSGSEIWLLPDPSAAAATPDYVWHDSLKAAFSTGAAAGSSSGSNPTATRAAIGAGIGAGMALLLLAVCVFAYYRRRSKHRAQHNKGGAWGTTHSNPGGAGVRLQPNDESSSSRRVQLKQQGLSATALALPPGSDSLIDVEGHSDHKQCGLYQEQLPAVCGARTSDERQSSMQASSAESSLYQRTPYTQSSEAAGASDSITTGFERWRAAISLTTLQMMERRMQQAHKLHTPASSDNSNSQPGDRAEAAATLAQQGALVGQLGGACAGHGMHKVASAGELTAGAAGQQPGGGLQLQGLIGQGSFGAVYVGSWHGKKVAVKVMQLPADALLGQQVRSSSAPHMAVMEAVVSSAMSHPNVVQVYTYMLNPLMVGDQTSMAQQPGSNLQLEAKQQQQQVGQRGVSGWELRLIMEYCDQGTLRDALDRKTILHNTLGPYLQPALVIGLAQDVAAALLHLHSEGVVHGDLKAANVLLTKGGEDTGGVWSATVGYRVTAKVADFGLALSLDPKDTHATMAARGTPTHMSPELFMSGHVSKASDVYAFGILLYEIMTGQRAYRGVPVPLLPHEVARQGLRPNWPHNLPSGYKELRRLAEACWAHEPQDRPCLQAIFDFLTSGKPWGVQPPPLSSSSGANAVELELQNLQYSAERLAKQAEVQPIPQHVVLQRTPANALAAFSWSEVTHGHLRTPVQQHAQRADQLVQQDPQHAQQQQDQHVVGVHTPAKDMSWSEVTHGALRPERHMH